MQRHMYTNTPVLFVLLMVSTDGRTAVGGRVFFQSPGLVSLDTGVIVYMCLCMLEASGLVFLCSGVIVYMCLCVLEVSLVC